uniref:Serine protease n=1 Tax=Entamoeba invadens TaxID=33085 RepID=S0AZL2_ENTIV|nr:hypothetical protein, conserved [Entamoeba invadens]
MQIFFFIVVAFSLNFQRVRFSKEELEADNTGLYMDQPLDHFDLTNTKKISIQYFLNDTYFTPEGPLFVDLGGEGAASAGAIGGKFVIDKYAQKYKGMMLAIEHRFYGRSLPVGGLSQENLGYLSGIQALEDYIHIISEIKKQNQITGPVIVFGGSYSGNLAVWIRQKYPNVVYAAVASSAPLLATNQFTQFMDVIEKDMGPQCAAAWKQANANIEQLYKTADGIKQIQTDFKTCKDIKNDKDFTLFLQEIQANFISYPQYNNKKEKGKKCEDVCNILTGEDTPYNGMKKLVEFMLNDMKLTCSPSSYDQMLIEMAKTEGEFDVTKPNSFASTRSWAWQICSEYSFFQPITETQPFDQRLNNDFYYANCEDIFGVSKEKLDKKIKHTNMMYGAMSPRVTNVAFTSGSFDPWSPLAKHETQYNDVDCYASYIEGTSHCADLYSETEEDPVQLNTQRTETAAFIDELIKRY